MQKTHVVGIPIDDKVIEVKAVVSAAGTVLSAEVDGVDVPVTPLVAQDILVAIGN